jgi:rare lipoprotein A (peptidoglycan hydrolase)
MGTSVCRGVTVAVRTGVFGQPFASFADGLIRCEEALALVIISALAVTAIAGCSAQNSYSGSGPNYRYERGSRYAGYSAASPRGTQVASWYGPGFEGHTTSSGERFDSNELTAASKTLPLGARVRVTNPDNGRSVVVRINDRGPFVRGRSLDLSHRAAQQIGLTGKGVGRVQVASADAPVSYTGAESSVADAPRYESRSSRYSRRTSYHRHYRHSRRHRRESNPIGTWLIGAMHL